MLPIVAGRLGRRNCPATCNYRFFKKRLRNACTFPVFMLEWGYCPPSLPFPRARGGCQNRPKPCPPIPPPPWHFPRLPCWQFCSRCLGPPTLIGFGEWRRKTLLIMPIPWSARRRWTIRSGLAMRRPRARNFTPASRCPDPRLAASRGQPWSDQQRSKRSGRQSRYYLSLHSCTPDDDRLFQSPARIDRHAVGRRLDRAAGSQLRIGL